MQRHARALREAQFAGVDRLLAGEHPQQRGLARPVAPGDGHALARLELERDAAQQRLACRCPCAGPMRSEVPSAPWYAAGSDSIPIACADFTDSASSALCMLLLVLAPSALGDNDGRGFYGATNDKVIVNGGFILIIFFPTFVFHEQAPITPGQTQRGAQSR